MAPPGYYIDFWLARRSRLPRPEEPFQVLELPEAEVRILISGKKGPALLLVPDPPNVIEHHVELIEELSANFRIVSMELPGFGRSIPSPSFGFTIQEYADVIEGVIRAAELECVTIVMACLGAYAGMMAAARSPGTIANLLLFQVPTLHQAQDWARGTDPCGIIHTTVIGQLFVRALRKRIVNQWYRSCLPDATNPEVVQWYQNRAGKAIERGSIFSLASGYQSLQSAREMDLSSVSQPVFLGFGTEDPSHVATRFESLAEQLPRAEAHRFTGCGHFPYLEHKRQVWSRAIQWLGAQR